MSIVHMWVIFIRTFIIDFIHMFKRNTYRNIYRNVDLYEFLHGNLYRKNIAFFVLNKKNKIYLHYNTNLELSTQQMIWKIFFWLFVLGHIADDARLFTFQKTRNHTQYFPHTPSYTQLISAWAFLTGLFCCCDETHVLRHKTVVSVYT